MSSTLERHALTTSAPHLRRHPLTCFHAFAVHTGRSPHYIACCSDIALGIRSLRALCTERQLLACAALEKDRRPEGEYMDLARCGPGTERETGEVVGRRGRHTRRLGLRFVLEQDACLVPP